MQAIKAFSLLLITLFLSSFDSSLFPTVLFFLTLPTSTLTFKASVINQSDGRINYRTSSTKFFISINLVAQFYDFCSISTPLSTWL